MIYIPPDPYEDESPFNEQEAPPWLWVVAVLFVITLCVLSWLVGAWLVAQLGVTP